MTLAFILAVQATAAGIVARGRRPLDLLALALLAMSIIVALVNEVAP